MPILTTAQKSNYQHDGFLVINHFFEAAICKMLMRRANEIITQHETSEIKSVFSAKSNSHTKNKYFLESGDNIRLFFEEGALNEHGELTKDKLLSINKIGHALHDMDPLFSCFSRNHKIAALVSDLGIQDPLLLQSMYIFKQPHIGGEVTCHQDSTYLYVKQQPVIGIWFALEDATIENGCLWAIPGGHLSALKSRSIRDKNDNVSTEIYDDTAWELDQMVPLEVPQGSVVVLHGLLPHMSKENLSPRSRHAYSLHIISGCYEYPEDNWLRRSENMPLRGFI